MKTDYKIGDFFRLKSTGEICIKIHWLPEAGIIEDDNFNYDPNVMYATVIKSGSLWKSGVNITIQLSDLTDMEPVDPPAFS